MDTRSLIPQWIVADVNLVAMLALIEQPASSVTSKDPISSYDAKYPITMATYAAVPRGTPPWERKIVTDALREVARSPGFPTTKR